MGIAPFFNRLSKKVTQYRVTLNDMESFETGGGKNVRQRIERSGGSEAISKKDVRKK
jgi:hypothetical protein